MRKRVLFLLIVICMLFAPNAYAKNPKNDSYANKCTYSYYSYGVGESTLLVHVYGDNSAYAWITKINGDSDENDEDIQNWSKQDYENNGKKCPPYAFIETSWGANVYLYYDQQSAVNKYNQGYVQASEAHILASNTCKEDFGIEMTDIYALNNDYRGSETEDTFWHGEAIQTCEYTAKIDGKVTSGLLSFYNDGAIIGEIVKHNGSTPGNNTFNVKKTKHYSSVAGKLSNQKCPYYMISDVKKINEVDFSDSKEELQGSWELSVDTRLISWTGSDENYNPQEDGGVDTKEDLAEEEKEKSEQDETRSGLNDDWNPDDPYGFHVGDQICAEKRIVQALKVLGMFIILARLAIPILIIIFGSKDFIETIMSGKEDTLKQDAMKLGWRVVVGLFVFFIPSIANAFLNGLTYYKIVSDDINQCQNCLLNPLNENYCKVGADSTGSTDASKKNVDYTDIEKTRNADASGDLGDNGKTVDASKIDPNTPGVDAGKIDSNTPSTDTSNNPGGNDVIIIQDPDHNPTVVTN